MPSYDPASFRGGELAVRRSRGADIRDAALISVAFCVLVLALWLDVRFVGGILERISTDAMYIHADFDTFWRSAVALLEGRDVYDTGARLENLNPPFWILVPRGGLDVRLVGGTVERFPPDGMSTPGVLDGFGRWGGAFLEGGDVYNTGAGLENLTPPFWILLISPLGLLEPLLAYRIFA